MNIESVKVGEVFSVKGEQFEKTKEGIIKVKDRSTVNDCPKGQIVVEKQILLG